MTRRHDPIVRAAVAMLLLALGSVRAHGAGQSAKDPKALAKAEAAVLDNAIADLKKQYAAHGKDPNASRLRTQSTYFIEKPVQLSVESLLDALERPVGDNPRCVAYVRWQLLSGAPEKFDPKHVKRAIAAYQAAPQPLPRFGLSQEDRSKLDIVLLKAKKEEDAAISVKVEERVREGVDANKPILAYRDALYARLPEGYESLVAGLRDAHERTLAAAGGGAYDTHAKRVVDDALTWAQSGAADPEQCARLTELVAKLRFVRSPPYYARVAWRSGRLAWSTRTDAVYSPKKLADLEVVLREAHKLGKAQPAAAQAARSTKRNGRQASGRQK